MHRKAQRARRRETHSVNRLKHSTLVCIAATRFVAPMSPAPWDPLCVSAMARRHRVVRIARARPARELRHELLVAHRPDMGRTCRRCAIRRLLLLLALLLQGPVSQVCHASSLSIAHRRFDRRASRFTHISAHSCLGTRHLGRVTASGPQPVRCTWRAAAAVRATCALVRGGGAHTA